MAKKKRGFKGMVIVRQNSDESIGGLRRSINRTIERSMAKLDQDADDEDNAQMELLKTISLIEAWQKWQTVQSNGTARLQQFAAMANQTGPDAGRIPIPTIYDAKAQQLLGALLDGFLGLQIDTINGFAADRAVTLWTVLASNLKLKHNLNDSLFGSIMFLQFIGGGLSVSPLFQLPGMNGINSTSVLIPRLLSANIALLAR